LNPGRITKNQRVIEKISIIFLLSQYTSQLYKKKDFESVGI